MLLFQGFNTKCSIYINMKANSNERIILNSLRQMENLLTCELCSYKNVVDKILFSMLGLM